MNKEVDIVRRDADRCEVTERDDESVVLFTAADPDDAKEWCDERGYSWRLMEERASVPSWFVRDLERTCDGERVRLQGFLDALGLRFDDYYHYRASAAWKDEPIHYTYDNRLTGWQDDIADRKEWQEARGLLRWLHGVADACHEMGFTLTFDEGGKHQIFCRPDLMTVETGA